MDWTRGRTIGLGSSATVSIAKSHVSGEVFAVKSAKLAQSQFLQKERAILSTLSSPHIVHYKGHNISTENGDVLYNLFLEYAPGGTISDAIRRQGGCLDEAAISCYAKQILLGLQHLHSNQIAHCDVKCRNILVAENGANVKLADLGCARLVNFDCDSPIGGTPLYMAPEVARGEEQGIAADVWALGCTIIEMATGRAPWNDVCDPVSALYRIGFSGDAPEIPSSLSQQGRDFVAKCLIGDPLERWSAGELLEHGFVVEAPNDLLSPTTVLDRRLWEEEEFESDQIWHPTRESSGSVYSAKERIRKLGEGIAASSRQIPNWASDEENWVTVRSDNFNKQDVAQPHTIFPLLAAGQSKHVPLCLLSPPNEANISSQYTKSIYDRPTNTNPDTNTDPSSCLGLGLEACDAASFSIRHSKRKAWMAFNCKSYVFYSNLNFVNKKLWLFVHASCFTFSHHFLIQQTSLLPFELAHLGA
ncbi:mitogen-activated protein kinase kinase kinase 18-like [Malus domestica]|uniref:mitogen-activated protein kinase kinase kinase 18-like n=1 Tax=Malus domestica TaxID=3750 RepID=UPI0010AAD8B8|nr:mitogen-activated protein kinase kinase kinase 18-like [Malus domestica]